MREEGGREGGGREGRRGEGGKRVTGEVRERRRARKEKGEGREGGNEERRKGREGKRGGGRTRGGKEEIRQVFIHIQPRNSISYT